MKNDCEVYRDGRYVLGTEEGRPYIRINGKRYTLTCHPYEPCLYITDEGGRMTAVHNAFDPSAVIERFAEGGTVTSITGREYGPLDFCQMVEYAAGRYGLPIDEAEKVFPKETKRPQQEKGKQAVFAGEDPPRPEAGKIIESDPAYDLIGEYPDCVIDFCLVKNERIAEGYDAHRQALLRASSRLFTDERDGAIWRFDAGKADARPIGTDELFTADGNDGKMTYRKAFLDPPCPNGYTDGDFDRINAALFPRGTAGLEAYEWTTDWSEYFDEGHEWWGALCLTVYDRALDRFAVIMASATD